MAKPDDIPQDVWQRAVDICDRFEPDRNGVPITARAIMAERDRCAKIADGASRVGDEPISLTISRAIRGVADV